eukprot:10254370-Alexandrium_andersonii.AAC.1
MHAPCARQARRTAEAILALAAPRSSDARWRAGPLGAAREDRVGGARPRRTAADALAERAARARAWLARNARRGRPNTSLRPLARQRWQAG